ncbi:hypothetical protein S83_026764 [Arachis hypogaea]|nr:Molybdopterin synthase catalytic subunit [Arachis hypogaea]
MATENDKNLVEISEHRIDIAKYMNYVSAPQVGAIATFAGTTRDTFESKTVLELRYEAYVPMAIRCIKSICLFICKSVMESTFHYYCTSPRHSPVGETSIFIAMMPTHLFTG